MDDKQLNQLDNVSGKPEIPLYHLDEIIDLAESDEKTAALKDDVELQPHQKTVLDRFANSPEGKVLLLHGLGSGKTLSGISAAEQTGKPYTAVVPASLRNNMRGEIDKFTDKKTPSDVVSYNYLANNKPIKNDNTLIFDEAHRLRNPQSLQAQRAQELADKARRVILLSGTPIVNDPSDLAVPLSILTGEKITPDEFKKKFVGEKQIKPTFWQRLRGITPGVEPYISNEDELREKLKGHVDYHMPEKPLVDTKYTDVPVEMGPEQTNLYKAMYDELPWITRWKLKYDFPLSKKEFNSLTHFLSGPRQVGLSTYPFMRDKKDPDKAFQQSTKLQTALEKLKEKLKDPKSKALIFSNYIDAGLVPYQHALQKNNIPSAIFHGGLSDVERKKIVDDYNHNKIRALLLGPSGSEGLSTRHTRLIQLLDPYWNRNRGDQSVGRGVRLTSHTDLPENMRNVEVQRFISKLPLGFKDRLMKKIFGGDKSDKQRATDDYLMTMSNRKEDFNKRYLDLLKEVGSNKEPIK